ncbi:hypothetical protein LEMLEM_LOCUS24498 [Lemmus lemmus]
MPLKLGRKGFKDKAENMLQERMPGKSPKLSKKHQSTCSGSRKFQTEQTCMCELFSVLPNFAVQKASKS